MQPDNYQETVKGQTFYNRSFWVNSVLDTSIYIITALLGIAAIVYMAKTQGWKNHTLLLLLISIVFEGIFYALDDLTWMKIWETDAWEACVAEREVNVNYTPGKLID